MGALGATLLVVMVVVVAEAQVVFPSNVFSKDKDCTASNGQAGFCYEFRSRKHKECPFYPSQNTNNPNVARHLTENVCRKTPREVYFCCPSNAPRPLLKITCKMISCQANAQCVEGNGAAKARCLCMNGYRLHNGQCLPTCQTTKCPENALCLEGSGSTGTSCKCKRGYKSTRTACIELRPQTPVNNRIQGFPIQVIPWNPYIWHNPNGQTAHIK